MRALILGFLLIVFSAVAAHAETAAERINRTGVLRCGYVEWPGYVERDAKSGAMSGMAYDVAEAIGKELNIKIEWTESVGWANFQEGLNTGRYDVACAGLWESGNRVRISLLTRPAFFSGMYAVVRADDKRFATSFDTLNDPAIKIESIEADVTEAMQKSRFPKATNVPQSPGVDSGTYLMNIATKKADAGFASVEALKGFNENNKDKPLALAAAGKPVRIFGNSFAMKTGESDLKAMLDSTVDSLINDGTMERLVKKHGVGFIAATPGYQD